MGEDENGPGPPLTSPAGEPAELGAYGLRIAGIPQSAEDLIPVPADWPELCVELEARRAAADPKDRQAAGTIRMNEVRAEMWLDAGGRIELQREPLIARFLTAEPVRPEAIVHPYLGLPAAIASRWLGRLSLHAAAFEHQGQAWALLGDREGGKSSSLGWLVGQGHRPVTDDVLVIEATTAFGGPRTVDLRAEARHLGGVAVGQVGNRPRWRIRPQPPPATLPIGGFVCLEWGEPARVEALGAEERLQGLMRSAVFRPLQQDGMTLLELASLPAWRFVRPRRIEELERGTEQLLNQLTLSGGVAAGS